MAAELPFFPRVIFTIAEPISLVAGFLGPVIDPLYFITNQLPKSSSSYLPWIKAPDATSHILAWQLGNAYLLLAFLGLFILNTTTELKVVRSYLWALWLGDIGHVAFTLYAMGWDGSTDVSQWNAVVWGNIGATVFLFLTRSAYFLGLFGGSPGKTATVRRSQRIKKQ